MPSAAEDIMSDARRVGRQDSELHPDRSGRIRGLSTSGFHDLAYVEWGAAAAEPIVFCVHGVTRQGRDFDHLGDQLASAGRRVVCPDLVGRGQSGRLRDPKDYTLPQYCADINALIAHTNATEIDWIGTSLGGLIGIVLAGLPGHPIRRLVINDIGPIVPPEGLFRIGRYVAEMPLAFETLAEAESYFRDVLAPFGALDDEHWRHLTRHSLRWDEGERRYLMLCDPTITQAFPSIGRSGTHLWQSWDAIDVPILLIRGTKSDLLPSYIAREMARRNPRMALHEVPGSGHAPPLMTPDQIETVTDFLTGYPSL
jgi:pimeloyl-ACP methyl ester carboxylesterase